MDESHYRQQKQSKNHIIGKIFPRKITLSAKNLGKKSHYRKNRVIAEMFFCWS